MADFIYKTHRNNFTILAVVSLLIEIILTIFIHPVFCLCTILYAAYFIGMVFYDVNEFERRIAFKHHEYFNSYEETPISAPVIANNNKLIFINKK